MKRRLSTGLLLCGALILAACGGTDAPDEAEGLDLVTDGTLTVCSDVPYPPFEFEDADAPTGYSGFDIELMEAIAAELDLDIVVIATGFEGLESGTTMAAGTCDLAASAMTITEERQQRLDFSDAYYVALQSLLVPAGSELSGLEDLVDGVSVGVQSATTGESFAQDHVDGAEIVSFENPGDLFVAMEAGQVDAILQDLPVNEAYARNNEASVAAEFDTDEHYGLAMTKDREDGLLAAINEALDAVRASGVYDELYEKYFVVEE